MKGQHDSGFGGLDRGSDLAAAVAAVRNDAVPAGYDCSQREGAYHSPAAGVVEG